MLRRVASTIITICDWIMKLAYVNVLWFLFTGVGFIVFGFMPATVALFTIVRKWLMKEFNFPIWSTFLTVYKNEFGKANGLGLILAIAGFLIYLDFQLLLNIEGILQLILFVLLLVIACFYLILLLYIFPVYVHYEFNIVDYLKNAFFLGIFNFHIVLLMLIGVFSAIFLLLYQPRFIPFFGAVAIAYLIMSSGLYSFNRIEKQQQEATGIE